MLRISSRNVSGRLLAALGVALLAGGAALGGAIIYVDADAQGRNNGANWGDAFNDLQDALAAAESGDEIWVAEGVYKPDRGTGERELSYELVEGVELYGGFAGDETQREQRDWTRHETILSGDLAGNDEPGFVNYEENSVHLVRAQNIQRARVDGFTITAGYGFAPWWMAGGILMIGSHPIIANCRIVRNISLQGGGLYVNGGKPLIVSCTFEDNRASGDGGGVSISANAAKLIGCRFLGNSAGRLGGGGDFSGGWLMNCLFVGNQADEAGGAIAASGLTVIGSTIARNSPPALLVTFAPVDVSNVILWNNGGQDQDAQIRVEPRRELTINYSCVQGWTGSFGGVGNIGDDPLFLDAASGDFRLSPTSPCVDAADNAALPRDERDDDRDGNTTEPIPFDILLRPRMVDELGKDDTGNGDAPIVDMGAFETEARDFAIDHQPVNVVEGGTGRFTVALRADPGGDVEVAVARESGDRDISVQSGRMLNFDSSNYDLPQAVVLAAARDNDNTPGKAMIRVSAAGLTPDALVAVEVERGIPKLLHVDIRARDGGDGASWETAFNDLQGALDTVRNGNGAVEEIWVAAGVYKPDRGTGERELSYELVEGVELYGGFAGDETQREQRDWVANETVLSGDLEGDDRPGFKNVDDNSYHVVSANLTLQPALLDGFTIRSGNADGPSESERDGGGITLSGSRSLLVVNCRLVACKARSAGGAVFAGSTIEIRRSMLEGNHADSVGGAMAVRGGDSSLRECLFANNSTNQRGGALCGEGVLVGCVFDRNIATNDGGAVYTRGSTFINCKFTGNKAWNGGAMYAVNETSIYNCTFSGNSVGSSGGAIYGGYLMIGNSTIAGNSSEREGAGIYKSSQRLMTFTNSVAWGNKIGDRMDQGAQISLEFGEPIVNYSLIQGWDGSWGGVGNIGDDPLFVDPDGIDDMLGTEDDDLRIRRGSPAIDAADNTAVPPDTFDLDNDGDTQEPLPIGGDGRERFVDDPDTKDTGNGTPPIVDIGMAEFQINPYVIEGVPVKVPEGDSKEFTVALVEDPGGVVEVSVSFDFGDEDLSVESGGLLIFDSDNFDIPQPVRLAAAEDGDFRGGIAVFRLESEAFAPFEINAFEVDNDPVPPVLLVNDDATGGNTGTSWQDALKDLQDALDLAREFAEIEEIWVAAGKYAPDRGTGDRDTTFELVDGVGVYGGFAGVETRREQRDWERHKANLAGANGERSPIKTLVTTRNVGGETVLDGFTLRRAETGMANFGGGPTIRNCRFFDHRESGSAMYNDGASPLVINCVFEDNFMPDTNGAGMRNVNGSRPTVIDTLFIGNRAFLGGGMYNLNSDPLVIGCTFHDNVGWKATDGWGGGMYNRDSSPILLNCVFGRNNAHDKGGGMFNEGDSSPLINNCVFWDNTTGADRSVNNEDTQIYGGAPLVTYCCIRGWTKGGVGNISDPPQFRSLSNADYHVFFDSPLIDAGDPAFVPRRGQTDMDGQKRVWNGRVDMGVDEFGSFVFADVNCDGSLDVTDVEPFVLLLIDPDAYGSKYPDCEADLGDTNNDGSVDLQDVESFIELLLAP